MLFGDDVVVLAEDRASLQVADEVAVWPLDSSGSSSPPPKKIPLPFRRWTVGGSLYLLSLVVAVASTELRLGKLCVLPLLRLFMAADGEDDKPSLLLVR